MKFTKRANATLLQVGLLLFSARFGVAQHDYKSWNDYAGAPDSSKFVDLTQITKSNVNQLQVAWTYLVRDGSSYRFNPIIVDGVMYVLARNSSLVALDATTGKEIWVHANLRGISQYGVNYWESKDRKDRRLVFVMNHYLQEINATTGKSILTFGDGGKVNLKEGLGRDASQIQRIQSSGAGRIFENLVILGSVTGEFYFSAPGDLRAFDVLTGKNVWTFHTIPHPGEFGYDTWPKDAWKYEGGVNTWGGISVDDKRGIAYFPLGSATYDYYGADRIGNDLFADSLLALDARTGKRLWHFQLVHHDLWDYDATAAPQLVTVRHDGKMVDAVAQATKQGFLYVFNRVTGEPLWPIEERPVPKSDAPGEVSSPTQPFPTVVPPFSRQKFTVDDINPNLSKEEQAKLKDGLLSGRNELFTPPSLNYEAFASPGSTGGANWANTAANPSKGLVFVSAIDEVSIYKLENAPPGRAGGAGNGGTAIYAQNCQTCHGANRAGNAGIPSLVGITKRLTAQDLRQTITNGRGEMPSFPTVDVDALIAFLSNADDGGRGGRGGRGGPAEPDEAVGGTVVESGGAPGSEVVVPAQYSGMIGPAYPPGLNVPTQRYYSGYGHDHAEFQRPPWAWVVAYDLNKGTIAWKVPNGADVPVDNWRHSMAVTSAGLIFISAKDGKVRAFDQDNGKVLWTADLPAEAEGFPSVYEAKGREYLVIPATVNPSPGDPLYVEGNATPKTAYIAFALPEKK